VKSGACMGGMIACASVCVCVCVRPKGGREAVTTISGHRKGRARVLFRPVPPLTLRQRAREKALRQSCRMATLRHTDTSRSVGRAGRGMEP
jgi:hypothetical protein